MDTTQMETEAKRLYYLINELLGDQSDGEGETHVSVETDEDTGEVGFLFRDGYDNWHFSPTVADAEAYCRDFAKEAAEWNAE